MGHKESEKQTNKKKRNWKTQRIWGVFDVRPCRNFTIALPLTKRRKGKTRRGYGLILSLGTGLSMRVLLWRVWICVKDRSFVFVHSHPLTLRKAFFSLLFSSHPIRPSSLVGLQIPHPLPQAALVPLVYFLYLWVCFLFYYIHSFVLLF